MSDINDNSNLLSNFSFKDSFNNTNKKKDKLYKRELLIEKIDEKHPVCNFAHISDLIEEWTENVMQEKFFYQLIIANTMNFDIFTDNPDESGKIKIKDGCKFNNNNPKESSKDTTKE